MHVLSTDDGKASIDKQISTSAPNSQKCAVPDEKLISSPAEKKLYEDYLANWSKYVQINDKALARAPQYDSAACRLDVPGVSANVFGNQGAARHADQAQQPRCHGSF